MRCESANKAGRWVGTWNVIHAADNGLVRLNGSIRPAEVVEVLQRKTPVIQILALNGMPNVRLPKPSAYLICPVQSVPAYRFANGVSPTRRAGEFGVYATCLGYPSWVVNNHRYNDTQGGGGGVKVSPAVRQITPDVVSLSWSG